VHNVCSEGDLRDCFYAHGEISSVRIVPQANCAFVTYTSRAGAELAVEVTHQLCLSENDR
jgi:pre-mRNA-splicing factor RBM22/SLT11